jgi:hypothetical protein
MQHVSYIFIDFSTHFPLIKKSPHVLPRTPSHYNYLPYYVIIKFNI